MCLFECECEINVCDRHVYACACVRVLKSTEDQGSKHTPVAAFSIYVQLHLKERGKKEKEIICLPYYRLK